MVEFLASYTVSRRPQGRSWQEERDSPFSWECGHGTEAQRWGCRAFPCSSALTEHCGLQTVCLVLRSRYPGQCVPGPESQYGFTSEEHGAQKVKKYSRHSASKEWNRDLESRDMILKPCSLPVHWLAWGGSDASCVEAGMEELHTHVCRGHWCRSLLGVVSADKEAETSVCMETGLEWSPWESSGCG